MLNNIVLNKLFKLYKEKKYVDIYTHIQYIHIFKQIKNKYCINKTELDKYIYTHNQTEIQHILDVFYKSIIIYRFIIKYRYKHSIPKTCINDTTLYSENINECTKPLVYLKCTNSNKYYAFTLYELNKLLTNTLLFNYNNDGIISCKMPKHPWTNELFTINQLEYITYIFKCRAFNYHTIIDMFARSNYNIVLLTKQYHHYLRNASTKSFIKNLDKNEFRDLFNSFWCVISPYNNDNIDVINNYTINKPILSNVVCKKCVLSIKNIQFLLSNILTTYFKYIYNSNSYTNKHAKQVRILKQKFINFLHIEYPHVFKNKTYYHLHYNRYNLLKFKSAIKKPIFSPILDFPISGFTNDCKIIYNCNGQDCILKEQVLVTYVKI